MNNHKDIKKTNTEYSLSKRNEDFSTTHKDLNTLINKDIFSIYKFVSKKTEKLVTALYMVTDCMETDDAIKGKLRMQGVQLLSDMHTLGSLTPMEKNNQITISQSRIHEILSFIEIASSIGFVSDMNSVILRKEFNILTSELNSFTSQDTHFSFSLKESMFDIPRINNSLHNTSTSHIKDIRNGHDIKDKRTYLPSSYNSSTGLSAPREQVALKSNPPNLSKTERITKILYIIKEYKKTSIENGEPQGLYNGISIKDISAQFMNCSEKTIQRELNDLLLNGKIRKSGSKRWSRYLSLE